MSCTGRLKKSDSTSKRSLSDGNKSLNMDSDDGDTTEGNGDDRDETKRKTRNLSEKKRRDQFNILINELCSMVSTSPRKMDKSTVLKATISFLKSHNELAVQSQVQESQENWKPSFLSNEEFTHLMLEALDGFVTVITSSGSILYVSESITSLLGYLPSDLVNSTIYDFVPTQERSDLYNVLVGSVDETAPQNVSLVIHFRLGGLEMNEENQTYQLVKLVGYFKRWISRSDCNNGSESATEKSDEQFSESNDSNTNSYVLVATGRLLDSELLRDMSVVVDSAKNEFSSRHSLEWKFLFLDHRAPPIIGYLPFEVLGTSGYDYYHCDDLEKVSNCHEMLMQKGEGTSCYYRFLTKGQQWLWLQTRFYITYHQWNSKPEFIVCTHRVVSYADVMKELRGERSAECTRLSGPPVPKPAKTESKKSSSSTSSSSTLFSKSSSKARHLNGNLSYGSMNSKRNCFVRKLDLPPKFTSALTSSHAAYAAAASPQQPLQYASVPDLSPISSSVSQLLPNPPGTVTVALHPQVPQFVQPSQINPVLQHAHNPNVAAATALQIPTSANFDVNNLPHQQINTNLYTNVASTLSNLSTVPTPTASPFIQQVGGHTLLTATQCALQDQLLMKHAQLQNQIILQQEELRRVSEQLLMSQFGSLQGDSAQVLLPQALTPAIPPQQHAYLHAHHSQQLNSMDNTAHLHYQSQLKGYQQLPPSTGHDGTT